MQTGKKGQHTEAQTDMLPKNVRQFGSINGDVRIYIEDYTLTCLKRFLLAEENNGAGVLIGKRRIENDITYLFIYAALQITQNISEKVCISDEIWAGLQEEKEKYFSGESERLLGWCIPSQEEKDLVEELEKEHLRYFSDNYSVILQMNVSEGEETFYLHENGRFREVEGFYVYYEKNDAMLRYISHTQKKPCVEGEQYIKGKSENIRMVLQKRKEEATAAKRSGSLLYLASSFLIMIIVVLGITMMNNYEKMQYMQESLNELTKYMLRTGNAEETSPEALEAMSSTVEMKRVSAPENTAELNITDAPVIKNQTVQSKKHTVCSGETLTAISKKYYHSTEMVEEICRINGIQNSNCIAIGDVIILP